MFDPKAVMMMMMMMNSRLLEREVTLEAARHRGPECLEQRDAQRAHSRPPAAREIAEGTDGVGERRRTPTGRGCDHRLADGFVEGR